MTASPRRRLVMIVDNQVRGDSRVQKMARSCADAGFDVHLVGRSTDGATHTWEIGEATVTLVPAPLNLLGYAATHPGRSLRWPLAYPDRERDHESSYRRRAQRADLRERTVRLQLARRSGRPALWGRVALRVRRTWSRGLDGLHALRHRQYASAVEHRKKEPVALDRARARVIRWRLGSSAWRRLDPTLVDFDLGMSAFVEQLAPDLVHAHDFRMVGIGVRVAERRRAAGHECRVVYDAHEFMPGVHARNLSWRLGNEQHEMLYARRADAVVTVSDTLALMLQERHDLRTTPTVVLNAPPLDVAVPPDGEGVRAVCGVPSGAPLLVYIGSPAPQRGIMTIVESLVDLPGTHAAAVLPPSTPMADPLIARADELGVADRFHVLPYVDPDDVVGFIRGADVGVIPIHHQLNHEISLITKYFDYVHAGLPIVVSDVETMSRTTRELGNGEVFTAGSTAEFVAAIRKVLDRKADYTAVYTPELVRDWSWEAQSERLIALYDTLVPPHGGAPA